MGEESMLQSKYTTTLMLMKEFNLPGMEIGSACLILHSSVDMYFEFICQLPVCASVYMGWNILRTVLLQGYI